MPVSGFCVSGIIRVGSDGNTPGTPELTLGKASGTRSTARKTWDSNVQDGIDSGWVPVALTAKTGGGSNGVELDAGGVSALYSGVTYGAISKVTLSAFVDGANKRMSFRNIVADFYDNDSDTDPAYSIEVSDASAPVASTMGMSGSVSDEKILNVVPEETHVKVILSAEVKLECTNSGLPAADSIAGGVYVFTDSCA